MLETSFTAPLWRAPGGDWYFLTLPQEASPALAERGTRPGFGSVRVHAEIGGTRWDTSVFPDSRRGAFVLPVKRSVRDAEGLIDGHEIAVRIWLDD